MWTLASEVLDALKRAREEVVFKIDLEKSYDCMDWEFLWFVLTKIGVGDRWIKRCVMCT